MNVSLSHKNRLKTKLTLMIIILSTYLSAYESWLLINPEARYAALAGAATAIVNDVAALYYNPAGLANCNELSAAGNYGTWLGNSEIYYAGAVRNLKQRGSLGTSLYLYNLDARLTGDEFSPTDFSYNYIYVCGGYAYNLTARIAVGVSLKIIYTNAPNPSIEGAQSINGKGFSSDVGIQIKNLLPFLTIGKNHQSGLSFGAAFCNLGPAIKYRDDFSSYKSKLVRRLRIGSAWHLLDYDLIGATISYDFVKDYYESALADQSENNSIGCAIRLFDLLFIHGGQHYSADEDYLTWGVAYDLDKFRISYCRYPTQKGNFFGVSYAF